MKFIKLLVILTIIAGGYKYWSKNGKTDPMEIVKNSFSNEKEQTGTSSQNGFISLPPMDGEKKGVVLVIAAENCPHEAAQRADGLAADLAREGIPAIRSHQANWNIKDADNSTTQLILSIMNGPLPIVFVNGRAKSNPTLNEVIAEFKSSR